MSNQTPTALADLRVLDLTDLKGALCAKLFGVDSAYERAAGVAQAKMISASVHLQVAKFVLP